MSSRILSYKYLLITVLLFVLGSCSVEKNTDTTRFYHSLTARFNTYFNGYESYKAGLTRINRGYRDDFAEILNVFEYSDPSTATMGSADMEKAIQKASKLISLKSITAKPDIDTKRDISEKERRLLDRKEYNEWVDDSYLLIGKARFYKHEFTEAESVFNYCITEANDPGIRTEATIWLARTKNENKSFSEASRLLNELEITGESSKGMQAMYYTTQADMFVKQKRYTEAIEPLSKAVELVSGKRNRYRLTYLLAQIYEQTGNGEMATANYRKVVNMNPPYEVEFNARINIAGVFDVNSGNPEEIKKELEKMLRDSKNKEFQDQIYFALGNLSMKEGNEAEAIEYFRKSASANSTNQNQKGRSYLSLADYYYERSDYLEAAMYLDSAVFFLDQSHPQYVTLRTRSQNLNELVSHLVVIEREDSLQRVAALPVAQRNELISGIIAKVSTAGSQGNSGDQSDRYNIGQYYENERRFQDNIDQEGKWYFYNQAALTFGRTEYRRRWGDRRLEDNWRRNNKTRNTSMQTMLETDDAAEGTTPDSAAAVINNKSPEFYLRNLPLNDSLLNISNEKLSVAFLNAGKAYAERISDTTKAIETLEALLLRFPSNPLVPEVLYDLYRLNEVTNTTKAETYRQRLIEKYPENEFARILSDPDYYRNKMTDLKVTEKLYEEAFGLYKSEQFGESITRINEATARYPDNPLGPKFMLLHSYAVARITDERTFKEDLNILVETYPGTPESQRAKELIGHINQKMPELKIEEEKVIAAELYVADTTVTRTFVLVIPDPKFNVNQATFDVISYNLDYYTNRNFKTEGSLVDSRFIMITISGFQNFSQTLEYYKRFESAKPVRNASGAREITFVISSENLQKLMKDKNPERYELFFRDNLLK